MSDYILKQNAGRGGAVIVTGTGQTIPAGEYASMTVISAITNGTFTTPLLTGSIPATLPALLTINTLITGGTITGTAIFYKGVTI